MSAIHKSITLARLEDAIRRTVCGTENIGFCLECGEEQDGVESDSSGYECESCGAHKVMGAKEIAMRGCMMKLTHIDTLAHQTTKARKRVRRLLGPGGTNVHLAQQLAYDRERQEAGWYRDTLAIARDRRNPEQFNAIGALQKKGYKLS